MVQLQLLFRFQVVNLRRRNKKRCQTFFRRQVFLNLQFRVGREEAHAVTEWRQSGIAVDGKFSSQQFLVSHDVTRLTETLTHCREIGVSRVSRKKFLEKYFFDKKRKIMYFGSSWLSFTCFLIAIFFFHISLWKKFIHLRKKILPLPTLECEHSEMARSQTLGTRDTH